METPQPDCLGDAPIAESKIPLPQENPMDFYFSEYFGLEEQVLEDYGALDICVVFDLPLFIDPFLLYSSEKPELRALHDQVIEYLRFLRDLAPRSRNQRILDRYFCFTEVRQTWLGFTGRGNHGSGLGPTFARSLQQSLAGMLADFGDGDWSAGGLIGW